MVPEFLRLDFKTKLAASLDPDSTGGKYVQIILEEASRLENALSEMVKERELED